MEEKLERIEDKIDFRQKIDEIKRKERQRTNTLVGVMFVFILVAFAGGFMLADAVHPGPKMIVPEHNYSIDDHEVAFNIQDTKVIFQKGQHPDMVGKNGYHDTKHSLVNEDAIYLNTEIEHSYDLYITCVHENLHDKGISGSDEDHRYISRVQEDIVSPTCLQVLYEYGKYQVGNQTKNRTG